MGKSYRTSRHAKKRPTRTSRHTKKRRTSRHTKKRRTSRHTKKRRQRRGGWPWGAKPAPKALVATAPVVRAPVCGPGSRYLYDTVKYLTYGNYEGDRKMVNDKCVADGQGKWVSTNGKMTLDGNWKDDKFQKPLKNGGPSSTHFDKVMTNTGYTEEGKTRLREFGSR